MRSALIRAISSQATHFATRLKRDQQGANGIRNRSKPVRTTISDKAAEPAVLCSRAEHAVAFRFNLPGDMAGLCLLGLRHRCFCTPHCLLAGKSDRPCGFRRRCLGPGRFKIDGPSVAAASSTIPAGAWNTSQFGIPGY